MSENDITNPQNAQPLVPVNAGESYLVLQYLDASLVRPAALHNTPSRRPATQQEMEDWPAAVVVDFMYACAAVRRWGTRRLHLMLRQHHASNNPAHWEKDKKKREAREAGKRKCLADKERAKRAANRARKLNKGAVVTATSGNSQDGAGDLDWVMDGLLELQTSLQREKAVARVRKRTTDWLDQVEAAE